MNCKNCGAPNAEGTRFCVNCGAPLTAQSNYSRAGTGPSQSQSWSDSARSYQQAAPVYVQPVLTQEQLPEKYRPLSAWAYFGYSILFSIPLVGFIFLIVFSFSDANINRRNYARSYFIILLLAVILVIILALTGVVGGLIYRYR